MKRYDVYGEGNEHEIDLTVEENSLGAWVKYEDAQAMKEAAANCFKDKWMDDAMPNPH